MRRINVLIASNSFKESLSSSEANNSIEKGLRLFEPLSNINFSFRKKEICDGGTGFSEILSKSLNGHLETAKSRNPLMKEIDSHYGVCQSKENVFIEVAQTAGLALLNRDERNPINTTSYGVGLQILDAINKFKPKNLYIGCGDTAINDYGIGMLTALGVEFLDDKKKKIDAKTPKDILNIKEISLSKSKSIDFLKTHCNVFICGNLSSIIGGKSGTSNVYAKQKGASDDDIEVLNKVKTHWLNITKSHFGENIEYIPGCGAGGGLGGSAYLFLNAKLTYSFEKIFEIINLEKDINWANLVLTGEGLLDLNSLKGKAPICVALHSKKFNKQVGLIAGSVGDDCSNVMIRAGVDFVEPLTNSDISVLNYISKSKQLVTQASFRLARKLYN